MKPKPLQVAMPHPFVRNFPKLSLAVSFIAAVVNVLTSVIRAAWPWRRELVAGSVLTTAWYAVGRVLPVWPALALVVAVTGGLLLVRPVRVWVRGWFR